MNTPAIRNATDLHVDHFAKVRAEVDGVRADIARDTTILIRWMFFFWLATVLPLGALFIALL